MKKMIYLFILVFSLSTLVACSDDEGTPVFTEPTEFVRSEEHTSELQSPC